MKIKQLDFKVKGLTDSGRIEGYLNTFNFKDYVNDITLEGAFTKTIKDLKAEGKKIPILFSHNPNEPIGVWEELKEDSNGLYGIGQINLDVQKGREAHSLAKQGALTGISIGYFVLNEEYDAKADVNYLKEISLREASLCVFPCNETSRVTDVKNYTKESPPTERELESILIDGGLSRSLSKKYVSLITKDARNEHEFDNKIEAALKDALAAFK